MGNVGATLAYTLMTHELATELALIDRSHTKARSDAQDLTHALTFSNRIIPIYGGDLEASANSEIIIITASVPWQPSFTSRFDLAPGNVSMFRQLIPDLTRLSPGAVFIVITNPLDIMTYFTIHFSGLSSNKVLGVGTLIDSARFRKILSENFHIHPDDIRAYIIGEHGDSQFPAFSAASIGGVHISDSRRIEKLLEESETSAYNIVLGKGYTNFAISKATSLIVESIVKNEYRTMPISTLLDGYLGINDVCLSIPVVVSRHGIAQKLSLDLNEKECTKFRNSAALVRKEIDRLIK